MAHSVTETFDLRKSSGQLAGEAKGQRLSRYSDKKPFKHLYNSARWQALRETKLTDSPMCVFCATEGRERPAQVVDHVKPHRGDVDLFFDFDNLQSLCKRHHDSDKQRIEKGGVVIQYGPDGWPIKARS